MSGQQIGTAVGFVAGFFLPGGPQVWAAIGGLIGGAIDPTKIEGPHIGDGRQQSSNEGDPIAWILGTAGWIQGNIVQVSAVREIKKEDDGKGGPVQVTYEARQDFCVMAAESCEIRGSTIVGVLMVRQNGQIVYDMRPEANFGAENAKFLEHHVFYYGHEDQMPNPTMEAISGVGNTPAYRGVFTMIGFDVDLTPFGNAIPTYEFVLVGEGEEITDDTTVLAAPVYGRFAKKDFPLVDPESLYTFRGTRVTSSGEQNFEADTIAEVLEHFSQMGYSGTATPITTYLGWSASTGTATGTFKFDKVADQPDPSDSTSVVLIYSEAMPDEFLDVARADGCPLLPYISPGQPNWYGFDDGGVGRVAKGNSPDPNYAVFNNCTNFSPEEGVFPYIQGITPVYIQVKARAMPPSDAPQGDPCLLGVPVQLPGVPGWTVDCEGRKAPQVTYEQVSGPYLALQEETISFDGLRQVFVTKMVGPVLLNSDPEGTQAFWEDAYAKAVLNGTMPAGLVYEVDYPVEVTFAYQGTFSTTTLSTNSLNVATALERIAVRGGLLSEDIDSSEIEGTLEGYPIQSDYNAADCIRPLLAYEAAYGAEYDGKIHFHPHGQAIEITVDPEDFVGFDDSDDDDTREQAVEYPRKVAVSYIDITQNYTVRPQYAYRTTPDIRAKGEETVQMPLCATPGRAARLADIAMKVSWARAQGTRKFSLPWVGFDKYISLVAGAPLALDNQRRVASRVSIEDGMISVEAQYDRQSAYTSIATGVPALPPVSPPSSVGGLTISAVMNLPPLRDQDDRLGVYVAVAGLLPGWAGCDVQFSADDGASWPITQRMTEASSIGYLLEPLADAAAEAVDTTNTLRVSIHGGSLDSITQTQFLNEQNPSALVRADSTAEIVQFRDAEETQPGRYNLTYLARGRLGTQTDAHPQGRRFVSLDSVYFVELPSAWRGKTILVRTVTIGTTPESNPAISFVWLPAYSQYELPPAHLTTERSGDTLTLTVIPRHRLGTASDPVPSPNLIAYSFDATDGVNEAHINTGGPFTPISIAGWSSPVTVTVRAVNRFTGPGAPLISEVEI